MPENRIEPLNDFVNLLGARVGFVTCRTCGGAILIDPRDSFDAVALHRGWHDHAEEASDE
jgi:hypothetical protein